MIRYAYSTFNVRLDTIYMDSELVRGFVRGIVTALKFLYESVGFAKQQFPTMPIEDLKATLGRSFADELCCGIEEHSLGHGSSSQRFDPHSPGAHASKSSGSVH
jgi:hypothetical protein